MKPIIRVSLSFLMALGLVCQNSINVSSAPFFPNANKILERVVNRPLTSYKGHISITRWFGKNSRTEEAQVFYSAPNQFRWNYLSPDGSIDRIVIGDGKNQLVYIPHDKAFLAEAPKSNPKVISQNVEWDLLFSNYKVSVLKEDKVIGRPVWILELKPLFPGKPRQHLKVDKETYVILENHRFQPKGGKIAALSRFVSFEPQAGISGDLFQIKEEKKAIPSTVHKLDPDYLDYNEALEPVDYGVPETLPNGFIFESGDMLVVKGEPVGHYRYTDGLAIVSIFVSNHPVKLKSNSESSAIYSQESSHNPVILSTSGRVLTKKGKSHFYTLVGDLSKNILKKASSNLK